MAGVCIVFRMGCEAAVQAMYRMVHAPSRSLLLVRVVP